MFLLAVRLSCSIAHRRTTTALIVVAVIAGVLLLEVLTATVLVAGCAAAAARIAQKGAAGTQANLWFEAKRIILLPITTARMAAAVKAFDDASPAEMARRYAGVARFCSRLDDPLSEAKAWQFAASNCWQRSLADSACRYYEHAAEAFLRAGSPRRARDEYVQAAFAVYPDQPERALDFLETDRYSSRSRYTDNDAVADLDRGFINHALGNYEKALEYYARAVTKARPGFSDEARAGNLLAALYAEKGSEWMEETGALAGLDRNQTWDLVVRARSADSAVRVEDNPTAPEGYDFRVPLAEYRSEADSAFAEADTFGAMLKLSLAARVFLDAGLPDSAVTTLKHALVAGGESWPGGALGFHEDLAKAFRRSGVPDSAFAELVRADSASAALDLSADAPGAQWELHMLYRQQGEENLRDLATRLGVDSPRLERLLRLARVCEKQTGG